MEAEIFVVTNTENPSQTVKTDAEGRRNLNSSGVRAITT